MIDKNIKNRSSIRLVERTYNKIKSTRSKNAAFYMYRQIVIGLLLRLSLFIKMAINARQKERYERVRFDVNDDINDHRDGRVAPCCCYCCRCIREDHYPIILGCAMKCDAYTNQPSMTHTCYRVKPMFKKKE